MKFEITLARLFSAVLHPLIIPTLGIIILFNLESYIAYSIPVQAKRFVLLMVFINTAVAPLLSVIALKRARVIGDMLLDERHDRFIPMLLSALYFILTYYLLRQITLPSIIYYYVMGAGLLVIICLLITLRWKISIHMASMGALTGFLIVSSLLLGVNINMLIILAVFLSGMLGFARLRLNAHSPAQVYAGFLLGVCNMLLLYVYLRV